MREISGHKTIRQIVDSVIEEIPSGERFTITKIIEKTKRKRSPSGREIAFFVGKNENVVRIGKEIHGGETVFEKK